MKLQGLLFLQFATTAKSAEVRSQNISTKAKFHMNKNLGIRKKNGMEETEVFFHLIFGIICSYAITVTKFLLIWTSAIFIARKWSYLSCFPADCTQKHIITWRLIPSSTHRRLLIMSCCAREEDVGGIAWQHWHGQHSMTTVRV